MPRQQIGFIGVGAMGKAMALRLLAAEYEVIFTTRRTKTAQELEAAGAKPVPTPLIVAAQSNVLMTCLPADSELFQIYLGPEGALEYLHRGATVIDFSTTSPMMIQRIASEASSRQIRVVDAPVSGGVLGAENGTLTIMVGSAPELFEETRTILGVLGSQLFHVGDIGMGKVFKIINNLLAGTTMVLIGEALALAANAGADLSMLYQVISTSSGGSAMWNHSVPKLLDSAERPVGFRLDLMRKDLGLASALAQDLDTPVALTSLASQVFTAACAQSMGQQDAVDVAKLITGVAKVDLTNDGP
jgi:3-hydroxyisobutyrate dehydrogenase-like beta-hydroxyacid dehydrogenase